jgi:hypothetical protein
MLPKSLMLMLVVRHDAGIGAIADRNRAAVRTPSLSRISIYTLRVVAMAKSKTWGGVVEPSTLGPNRGLAPMACPP